MATYVMFGKYSLGAAGEISAERTKNADARIRDIGGELKAAYFLLGETDLVLVAEFPGTEEAMRASVVLSKLLGISFTTSPAVSGDDFDRLIAES